MEVKISILAIMEMNVFIEETRLNGRINTI